MNFLIDSPNVSIYTIVLTFVILMNIFFNSFYKLTFVILDGLEQEEGWVVCRVFKKRVTTTIRKMSEHDSPCWYDDQVSFMQDMDSPNQTSQSNFIYQQLPSYPCKKELDNLPFQNISRDHFLNLPLLESPKLVQSSSNITSNPIGTTYDTIDHSNSMLPSSMLLQEEQVIQSGNQQNFHSMYGNNSNVEQGTVDDQVTDWRVLDKFVASQLSQDASKENNNNIFHGNIEFRNLEKQEMVPHENASTSNTSCSIDLWK